MPKIPGKMHMYDMVNFDTIVFETEGGEAFKAPPPRIVSCLKLPGSDRVKSLPHARIVLSCHMPLRYVVDYLQFESNS